MKIRPVGAEFYQCARSDRLRETRRDKVNGRVSQFYARAQKPAIISHYSIHLMAVITYWESVYRAVRTGSLNVILRSSSALYLCVLCGSRNKQRLFPYTALTDWFL